ncbi:uncharacterized protein LY79DRAFT_372742 [Colletotrichum navitas]|uniref:Uncharacterized protein n=1 Tax=Colletotrichum navitas TaxID=681940 RepID=A0AAD8PPU0_9PEZI|nr:uncharacterized protein LY79DRAFT_372742 [Colletotrichum navitas]KAK1574180.1 hypothetical protein LY79DRAFT_372742 [Colletotrichum navitas]
MDAVHTVGPIPVQSTHTHARTHSPGNTAREAGGSGGKGSRSPNRFISFSAKSAAATTHEIANAQGIESCRFRPLGTRLVFSGQRRLLAALHHRFEFRHIPSEPHKRPSLLFWCWV